MPPTDDNPDEPRAIDIVRAAGASTDERELDAETIAQLSAWFAAPVAAPAPPPPTLEDEERAAYVERLERALEAVEPAFLERRFRFEREAEALLRLPPPPPEPRPISKFDVDVWRLPTIDDEAREVDIPYALQDDLKVCAPQAVLRDLHRVVQTFSMALTISDEELEQAEELRATLAGSHSVAEEVMRTSYYMHFPTRLKDDIANSRAELRAIITGPWEQVEHVKMRSLSTEQALAVERWFSRR
jgi:hypothetical protein